MTDALYDSPAYLRAVEAGVKAILDLYNYRGLLTPTDQQRLEVDAALCAALGELLEPAGWMDYHGQMWGAHMRSGDTPEDVPLFRIRESE